LSNALLRSLKNRLRGPYKKLRRSYVRWRHGFTASDLQRTLSELGIRSGDAILLHSSMAGFEGFRGNLPDVIHALQELVGPQGALLMPTLSMAGSAIEYARSNRIFDPRTTPSQVGILPELFRRSPGVVRSLHPTHSVAVWSAEPAGWIEGHPFADSPCARGTPWARLDEHGAKMVFAGIDISCMTFFHYAEDVLEAKMPFSPFTTERFTMRYRSGKEVVETSPMRLYDPQVSRRRRLQPLAEELKKNGHWREARTGSLNLIVLDARATLETLESMAARGAFCYSPQ
jgi:aminoglycoside 3-N-acetyltransferase